MSTGWSLRVTVHEELPPLAWVARAHGGQVFVQCGTSVRHGPGHVIEGTWCAGPAPAGLLAASAVFGSGVVVEGTELVLVTPSHQMEGLFTTRRPDGEIVAGNSLTGVMVAAGVKLLPQAPYPSLMRRVLDGQAALPIRLPTSGEPIEHWVYDNVAVGPSGTLVGRAKPSERPFESYGEYVERLRAAMAAALANAPGYEPVVTLSSGYDSTAAAALMAGLGGRHAVSIATTKQLPGRAAVDDSGRAAAEALGLQLAVVERGSWQGRDDFPEAEFLATGMSGEDVIMLDMEMHLRGRAVLTGHPGDATWKVVGPPKRRGKRTDLSGSSMGEMRLRTDFIHVAPAMFGYLEQASLLAISQGAEMRPWSTGGEYDRPIARRLVEEAGVPRDAFATAKRATSGTFHVHGTAEMSPATAHAVRQRATSEGVTLRFGERRLRRSHRGLIRLAALARVPGLAAPLLERRRSSSTFGDETGNLLLRWAVDVIRPRYAALARPDGWHEP
jgi:hypothetical protein